MEMKPFTSATEQTSSTCLGVVLAGGLSSRMGQDKSTLNRNGQSMLAYSQQLLHDCNLKDVVISGDRHQINDKIKQAGPLGGIYSVIEQCKPTALLILPVDLPLMTSEALMQLKIHGELSQKACCFEQHQLPLYLPINGYVELFFKTVFTTKNHQGKGPAVKALLNAVPHIEITSKSNSALFNTNSPEQWSKAQAIFQQTTLRS